jgi:predicted Zn-dependent peptidase
MVIEGKPADGVSVETALEGLWTELRLLAEEPIDQRELLKIQHRFESTVVFSETSVLNKAQNLAYYEILNRAEWMNEEVGAYLNVSAADMQRMAQETFRKDNSATLVYVPEGK